MAVRFVAYIDEAGDTGLGAIRTAGDPKGATEWLVLGCLLVKQEDDQKCLGWVKRIKARFTNVNSPILHYKELLPAKKTVACQELAELPCHLFVVASNKKNIEKYRNEAAEFVSGKSSNWLYWWLARLLLERVTNHCEKNAPAEDRFARVQLVFSRRRMRYADFRDYLKKIRRQSRLDKLHIKRGDIRWAVVDEDECLLALDSGQRAGLQLADLVASAFFQAVEQNRPAQCDPQFAKLLKPRMAVDARGRVLGYGLKTMPDLWDMGLEVPQRAIFEFYGYSPRGW